jgi:hypothetical protein
VAQYRAEILTIFSSYFGRNDDFKNSFCLLTFTSESNVNEFVHQKFKIDKETLNTEDQLNEEITTAQGLKVRDLRSKKSEKSICKDWKPDAQQPSKAKPAKDPRPTKGGLISESFSLWLKFPKKRCQMTVLSTIHVKKRCTE